MVEKFGFWWRLKMFFNAAFNRKMHGKYKNVLHPTCEICGSFELEKINERSKIVGKTQKNYNVRYRCLSCGATCKAVHIWKQKDITE